MNGNMPICEEGSLILNLFRSDAQLEKGQVICVLSGKGWWCGGRLHIINNISYIIFIMYHKPSLHQGTEHHVTLVLYVSLPSGKHVSS